jgi:hypothetical protein
VLPVAKIVAKNNDMIISGASIKYLTALYIKKGLVIDLF